MFSSDSRKNIINIIVGIQRGLVQGAFMNALDDFLAREGEDCLKKLNAFLLVRRRQDKKHAGAVLDVTGRQQLALQDLHNDGRLGLVKTARIAEAVQFGEERRRPFVVVVPQPLEKRLGKAGPGLDLEGILRRRKSIFGERRPSSPKTAT